jgi:hypothetical protein
MPLKLRPSGLGSGIDKGRQDYETREGPEKHLRWFRSFAVQGPMTRADDFTTNPSCTTRAMIRPRIGGRYSSRRLGSDRRGADP